VRVKEVSQLEDSLRAERSSADNDVTASKARVIELQAAVQVRGCWAIKAIVFTFCLQRLGQKRAELHAQEQQLVRERGSMAQQFEAESNALYEATKHVSSSWIELLLLLLLLVLLLPNSICM